jgi:AcrR family transcriptional regulator
VAPRPGRPEATPEVTSAPPRGSVWARFPRERRSGLTREAIVAAAIAIADADGADAVSIRRVAAELGSRAMSLYTYIDRKEDLLDLMVDEVAAEVIIHEPLPADWRAAIMTIASREREVAARHPWIVDYIGRSPSIGPNALRHVEQSLAAVRPLGVDGRSAWRIVAAVDHYTRGYVISEALERRTPRRHGFTDFPDAQRQLLMQPHFLRMIESGQLPNLAPVLKDGPPADDDAFERGLAWLLDGIERDFAMDEGQA